MSAQYVHSSNVVFYPNCDSFSSVYNERPHTYTLCITDTKITTAASISTLNKFEIIV